MMLGAAQQRAQPRQQFLGPKRLRQVIVSTAVETVDALHPAATRCQNQDRHFNSLSAPTLQQRQTVKPGQSEVEYRCVEILGAATLPGIGTVVAMGYQVTRSFQCRFHMGRNHRFVFREEDMH